MNRTLFSALSSVLPASDPQRAVTLHQTYRIKEGKDTITATGPRPATRLYARMDLHPTIFFLGATLGETAGNRSRRSIAAVFLPQYPSRSSFGTCKKMSYLYGGDLMMSASPITFSKYCVQRNPGVWYVVMSHDVEHDRLLCDPRERAVRRAACNWVTVATVIDRLWRRRMHRHLLSLLGLRNGSYRLEGKGRHGLGRRLALVGKGQLCAIDYAG